MHTIHLPQQKVVLKNFLLLLLLLFLCLFILSLLSIIIIVLHILNVKYIRYDYRYCTRYNILRENNIIELDSEKSFESIPEDFELDIVINDKQEDFIIDD